MKDYYIQTGIGKAKYVVNFHDGIKMHKDQSAFYDIRIFKNKRKLNLFISSLKKYGYIER